MHINNNDVFEFKIKIIIKHLIVNILKIQINSFFHILKKSFILLFREERKKTTTKQKRRRKKKK